MSLSLRDAEHNIESATCLLAHLEREPERERTASLHRSTAIATTKDNIRAWKETHQAIIDKNHAEVAVCELREKMEDFRTCCERMKSRLVELEAFHTRYTEKLSSLEMYQIKEGRPLLTKIVDALECLPDETTPATYRERMQDHALTVLAVLRREGVLPTT
jgi:hypothetical protein